MNKQLKVFAGSAGQDLAIDICKHLNISVGDIYLHKFPSGEHYCQYKENIRDSDVFLIQPICNPAHERLMELLVMIDAAKRASAGRITVVAPYLGYLRQDRKTKSRTPITARLVADLLIAAGAQRVVGIDFHCEQAQGFFDIPVDHLYAAPVITNHILQSIPANTLAERVGNNLKALPSAIAISFSAENLHILNRAGIHQTLISDVPLKTSRDIESASFCISFTFDAAGVYVGYTKNRYGDAGPDALHKFLYEGDKTAATISAINKLQELIAVACARRRTMPVIVSPDAGGIKRAAAFAESIDTQFAYISKKRINDTEVKVYGITGEVAGQEVLIVDDMTESCGTLIEAAKVCKQHGAIKIRAAVTHAMLNVKSFERLQDAFKNGILHELIITNTAVDNKEAESIKNYTNGKVTILDVSNLLGTAISHINQGLSITELFAIKGF